MSETNSVITCTLCGNSDTAFINNTIRNNTDPNCNMYECKHCGTHFIYPLPPEEKLEQYYDGTFREEVHSSAYYDKEILTKVLNSFTPEAITRVKRVKSMLSMNDEILEIGCSVGYFLNAVKDNVALAYGTEWDSKARTYIQEVINNKKIKTEKNPQDFGKKFDKIFMFHVLEHIANPISFLKELKPLLKEQGKIFIEVPNVDDIMVKTFHSDAFKNFYYKKAHIFNFNETGLSYIFEQSEYNYDIHFIQRYDISNHFYWLAEGKPGGKGAYTDILSEKANQEYVNSLVKAKQTDTLFAVITPKE